MLRSISMTTMLVLWPCMVFAAHPLITDDAGTTGWGKFQLEVNGQYDADTERAEGMSVESRGGKVATTLSYGVVESTDLVLNVPFVWGTVTEDGLSVYKERGFSDISVEAKWRFFEKEGLSFAVKPGISFPTGDDDKGLGTGKTGYHLFLIGSTEAAPWAFHANLGYVRNENSVAEEKDIWHASLAATYEIVKDVQLVGNVGIERNADRSENNDSAFAVTGVIYSITESFDIDFGVHRGITKSETDYSLLAGLTWRL